MTDLNDLLVTSPDQNKERLETLKELFPDLFTDEGKFNPVELKRLLEGEVTTDREQYNFNWRGKGKAKRHAFAPSRAALTYDPKRSVNPDKANGNMIIEGENLEVLKLLTSAYRQQVDCIYIDPPYNTGGDFIYSDNYARDKREYWEENGSYQDGVKMDTNPEASGRFHSDWLSMMYSRLLIARQLLRDDGVIFISIDDNEASQLKLLCNEIFGEDNLLDIFYIQVRYAEKSLNEKDNFQKLIEQVLVYAKDKDLYQPNKPSTEYDLNKFRYKVVEKGVGKEILLGKRKVIVFQPNEYEITEEEPDTALLKATWASGSVLKGNASGKFFHTYLEDRKKIDGLNVLYKVQGIGEDGLGYRYFTGPKKETATKGIFYSGIPLSRKLEIENGGVSQKEKPIINFYDFSADFGNIRHEGGVDFRSGKKPVKMLKQFINYHKNTQAVVLDFFAGSGSTAQAVVELNNEDEGNRQFILVQIPEAIDADNEAYKDGYRTISQITIERCKRVIQGYGKDTQPLDTGFKVYRLTKSHFPRAEFQPDPDKSNEQNVELLKQYINEKEASFQMAFEQDDVFDEVLLKHGFKLDYKLTKQEGFGKNAVYLAQEGDRRAYICLDTSIASETIDFFKTHTDTTFICLERALDTTKKWNLNHTLGERLKAL